MAHSVLTTSEISSVAQSEQRTSGAANKSKTTWQQQRPRNGDFADWTSGSLQWMTSISSAACAARGKLCSMQRSSNKNSHTYSKGPKAGVTRSLQHPHSDSAHGVVVRFSRSSEGHPVNSGPAVVVPSGQQPCSVLSHSPKTLIASAGQAWGLQSSVSCGFCSSGQSLATAPSV